VEKVSYNINWAKFTRGKSFFIPCLDPAAAKTEMAAVFKRLKLKTLTKIVIVDGVRGLRVWRM
jgi:hypothetical protein